MHETEEKALNSLVPLGYVDINNPERVNNCAESRIEADEVVVSVEDSPAKGPEAARMYRPPGGTG